MELQNGAIVIIIIILSFILISYAIYLIYSENIELKKKINEVYNNMSNLETNITNFFTQQLHDQHEEESEDDQDDQESEDEEDELISFNTNKPSLEMFGNSSEELEYLKQFQNKIQQGTIEEIEENEQEEIDENQENEEENKEENEEEIKINISSKNKKCSKILTHGKRKDQECNRPVTGKNDFCKLHLGN
jgi:hypothetical protein